MNVILVKTMYVITLVLRKAYRDQQKEGKPGRVLSDEMLKDLEDYGVSWKEKNMLMTLRRMWRDYIKQHEQDSISRDTYGYKQVNNGFAKHRALDPF
jgi:hypothetical protein